MFFLTRWRRNRLKQQPFPPGWLTALDSDVPLFRRLPAHDRRELLGHIMVFLDEKRFEGCNGLVLTDTIRLVIASQACLLLLHRDSDYFPPVRSLVIYPDEYVSPWQEVDESGILIEGEDIRAGEYAGNGALVLSWQDVCMSGADRQGAYNVVIHEFAHQLDAELGITTLDGFRTRRTPEGLHRSTLEREYHRLQHGAAHRRPSVFDHYGAESPTEFFAVAVETFFETPLPFRTRHPELYRELSDFFKQDPAGWPA